MNNIKEQIQNWIPTAQVKCNSYYSEQWQSQAPQLSVTFGRKYAKIMDETSAWAFIALTDDPSKGQATGDLLKPASWATPARHSRGNILNGTAVYNQYGPAYLK
tara:strand:- start:492 stop:803 length:312 start_codon:yes stop_codon:yes gene_type:complete